MVLKQLTSQGLDDLGSKEQLHLLDAVDSLRSQGISHYISLPQIIVCGDQSSGKSSVLEAISGVSFPVKSNLCTRFPTELILRKTNFMSVKVSIVPDYSRSESEKASLSGFHEKLDSFQDLPTLIDNAKAAMGIMTLGKAFSKDLLRIEISGPDRPHLTIVDLPGLIHSENKHQSASDIELITDIVKSYMEEPRSIILAVVSAKNDYANQIVLKLARETDPKSTRTLGVITKPDVLRPGSGSEDMYISLARNQDVEFRLGWHVLRNKDTDAEAWTLAQRDAYEAEFFSGGAWASLPASQLGIKTLRDRLSKLLLHQIASELPSLMEEISAKSALCQWQLNKLGRPRTNEYEQRIYLVQISQSFQALVQAAVNGTYDDPFFGGPMSTSGYQKRIRAVVQNLNLDFATEIGQHGQRYRFLSDSGAAGPDVGATLMTKAEFVEKIVRMMDRSRGRELPSMFSPMIVSDLFKEQSSPWKDIAQAHVKRVWNAARLFLRHLITHVTDMTTVKAILEIIVEPKLDAILENLCDKVSGLLKSHQTGHPITYNHYFTETLQKIRLQRQTSQVTKVIKDFFGDVSLASTNYVDTKVNFGDLLQQLVDEQTQNMSHYAASEALDCLDAYYKVALERFIDDIAVEVVETCLVAHLGQILNPLAVSVMMQDDVARIAGETEESRAARQDLEGKLTILKSGIETCKRFTGFRVTGLVDEDNTDHSSAAHEHMTEPEKSVASETADSEPDHEIITSPENDVDEPIAEVVSEVVPMAEPEDKQDDEWASFVPSKKGKKKKKGSGWPNDTLEPEPCDDYCHAPGDLDWDVHTKGGL